MGLALRMNHERRREWEENLLDAEERYEPRVEQLRIARETLVVPDVEDRGETKRDRRRRRGGDRLELK